MAYFGLSLSVTIFLIGASSVGDECVERFEAWATAAQEVPRDGWITSTSLTYSPSGDTRRRTSTKAVVAEPDFLLVEEVGEGDADNPSYTRMLIVNPSYLAEFIRTGERPWLLEKLSLYTDADFHRVREEWFRRDPGFGFSNYQGTLSVLLSGQYCQTHHEQLGNGRERFDVQVSEGSGVEKYEVSWSDIESFSAVFENDVPIPTEISGKQRGRNRFFSRSLSDWVEIDGHLMPSSLVLKTDDRDQPAVAIRETTLDFSSYDDPVDSAIFYLSYYGLPEPRIEMSFRTKLLYSCVAVACFALIGWVVRKRLRSSR